MTDIFRTYTDAVTRTYARLADEAEATDDTMSAATTAFRGLHESLIDAFDLDTDATPDRVVTAVYAHYNAHGGEATTRKLLDEVDVEYAWSTYPAAR